MEEKPNGFLRVVTAPFSAVGFTAALVITGFTELGRLMTAPLKFSIKDFSWSKMYDDLHHAEEVLKESRLVKNITGRIWPFVPALLMMGLVVGIPLVALAAKGAALMYISPWAGAAFAAKVATYAPFLSPYIGSASAALGTLLGTAAVAKLAKIPAIIIATCCPQFQDSWIHKKINIPMINGMVNITKWAAKKVENNTVTLRAGIKSTNEYFKSTWPVRAIKAISSSVRSVAASIGAGISRILPKRAVKAPRPEADWKLKGRAALHTMMVYGTSTALPLATYTSAVLGFGAGKAALGATAGLAYYAGITLGVVLGGGAGLLVVLGGTYGVARMSQGLFARAARGVCETSKSSEIATAQAMHEGMLLGTVATGGIVEMDKLTDAVSHMGLPDVANKVTEKNILIGTGVTASILAAFGGAKKILAEYRRINDLKREASRPRAFGTPVPSASGGPMT